MRFSPSSREIGGLLFAVIVDHDRGMYAPVDIGDAARTAAGLERNPAAVDVFAWRPDDVMPPALIDLETRRQA